jgi:hypothetical protein
MPWPCLAHATAYRPSTLIPGQLLTIAQALWRSQTAARVFYIYPCNGQNIYYLLISSATPASLIKAIIIDGTRSSGCCGDGLSPSTSGKAAPGREVP